MTNLHEQWMRGAPEPDAVLSRVLSLVAQQVKTMTDRRLRLEDHTGRMRLVLAADFYYDFFDRVIDGFVPPAAHEAAELHLRFAEKAIAIHVRGDNADDVMALAALADECFLARGRICASCGLPTCLHAGPDTGGPDERGTQCHGR